MVNRAGVQLHVQITLKLTVGNFIYWRCSASLLRFYWAL